MLSVKTKWFMLMLTVKTKWVDKYRFDIYS